MNRIEDSTFHPYHTPRHADLTHEGLERGRMRDLQNSLQWPWLHYTPRHSAFVAKVRAS
jgi:hypothetical protein